MNNSSVKLATSCAIRYIVTSLITFFIYLSVSVIMIGLFTENTGYSVFRIDEGEDGSHSTLLYSYSYSDGEDLRYAEYESQGIKLQKVEVRGTLEGTAKIVTDAITQLAGIVILFAFVHDLLWKAGDSDRNLSASANRPYDKLRGFKIGLLANTPLYLSYLVFVIAKTGLISGKWYSLFKFTNFTIFSFVNLLYGQSTSSADLIAWQNVILGCLVFVILPLLAQISYTLGLKRIIISEKILYKKEKGLDK